MHFSSTYEHKSGAKKRAEKKERVEKLKNEIKNNKSISSYFSGKPSSSQTDPVLPSSSNIVAEFQCADEPSSLLSFPDPTENIPENKYDMVLNENQVGINTNKPTDGDLLCKETQLEALSLSDPGQWPLDITDSMRVSIVESDFKGINVDLMKSFVDSENRHFTEHHLFSKISNGKQRIKRDWLIWSETKRCLYCAPCILFSSTLDKQKSNISRLGKPEGFDYTQQTWKRLYEILPSHENNGLHKNNYISWRNLEKSLKCFGVDYALQKQITDERDFLTQLLTRLLDVTLFLASRNLAFRGNSHKLGESNNGNFLGVLELLAKYDPFLNNYLKCIEKKQDMGDKTIHYLSWRSQDEFLSLCGSKVRQTILTHRQEAVYFSFICDATPDISKTEQNVLILRYVLFHEDERQWRINERFLEFFDFYKKTGKEISDAVLREFEKHGIDIQLCRGQAFDNGANMAGKIRGVQARIQEKNAAAIFSPCGAHSLNLVGVNAAKCCPHVSTFFGCVNQLYTFCSASVERWQVLLAKTGCSLHKLSDTRWSARIDALKVLSEKLPSVISALHAISDTCSLTSEARAELSGLVKYFEQFKHVLLVVIWADILKKINYRSLVLQSSDISLDVEVSNISDLRDEIQRSKNKWGKYKAEATELATQMGIECGFQDHEKRSRKRKTFFDEDDEVQRVSLEMKSNYENDFISGTFNLILDTIVTQFDLRFKCVRSICQDFAAIHNQKHSNSSNDFIPEPDHCQKLILKYPEDLSSGFIDEINHLAGIFCATFPELVGQTHKKSFPLTILNHIYKLRLETIFPEVCIALRLFCTLPVSVAEGERGFSKLSLIKNHLRSTLGEEKLNNLTMLSIENELASHIEFKDIINDFVNAKVRRFKM